MDKGQKAELTKLGGNSLRFDVPMAEYTTFRAGGRAEALYDAYDVQGLLEILRFLQRESIPYLVFGGGSNLLVRDGGLEGVAIRLKGSLAEVEWDEREAFSIVAGGGLPLSGMLKFCRREGLRGLEFLSGIPGTVGGAVAMNAGAYGRETGEVVRAISLILPSGEVALRGREELAFSYRSLKMEEGSVILRTRLALEKDLPEAVSRRVARNLESRKKKQPLEYPSAGSVFKNPVGDYAGRLIETAGLKGERAGGAMISPKHANYIVNMGGATAQDILTLVRLARERVRQKTGFELELEIRVVGAVNYEKEERS